MILEQRVLINGKCAMPGNRVVAGDVVKVDDRKFKVKGHGGVPKGERLYIAFNKPKGIVCTTDEREPDNIISYINHPKRLFPIGRLDKLSEGLILLTNDGDIVNKILRAGNDHQKEYIVTVNKPISPQFVKRMSRGVRIPGATTLPCEVTPFGEQVFRIVLSQGLNRQIRRMCEALGYKVTRLKRTRIMHIKLGKLKPGQWRELTPEETRELMAQTAHSSKTADPGQ